MFETSADILNWSLALGWGVLVIFLCIFLYYAISILKDITKVVDDVTGIVDKVHSTVVEPLRAIDFMIERAKPYIDMAMEKKSKAKKSAGRRKKS